MAISTVEIFESPTSFFESGGSMNPDFVFSIVASEANADEFPLHNFMHPFSVPRRAGAGSFSSATSANLNMPDLSAAPKFLFPDAH